MIKYQDKVLFEDFYICPYTGIITDEYGNVQRTYVEKTCGDVIFKGKLVYRLQMHTHKGWQPRMCIIHKDGNLLNNALDNLEYITKEKSMSRIWKGRKRPFKKRPKLSEEKTGKILYNNGIIAKYFREDPGEGWVKGNIKK